MRMNEYQRHIDSVVFQGGKMKIEEVLAEADSTIQLKNRGCNNIFRDGFRDKSK